MSLHMFKCQVSNVFHQFKWVLCEKCHHSPFLCVALFQNCDLCLFQLGNLLVFSFKFSLVLTAKCTGKDDLMLFFSRRIWCFFWRRITLRPSSLTTTEPSPLPWGESVAVYLILLFAKHCRTFQNKRCRVAAVQSRDECFRCFWTSHSTFSWCSV